MHLDYPPIAAYFHYFMSLIYLRVNPNEFYQIPVYSYYLNKNVTLGVKTAVLVVDVLTYYPAVVYVVWANMKNMRKVHQMGMIALLLNLPMFAFIQYANTQACGPPLAGLILSLHFAINDRPGWSTVFFTLGFLGKQAVGPFVLPLGIFLMARLWAKPSSSV